MSQYSTKTPGIRKTDKPNKFRIDYYDWDGTHRTKIFTGKYSDAANLRQQLLAKVNRIKNGLEQPDQIREVNTLEKLWTRFKEDYQLQVRSGSKKKATLDRYECSIASVLRYDPSLFRKNLNLINSKDLELFKVSRLENEVSKSSVNTDLRSLRVLFNYGLKQGVIGRNVIKQVPYVTVNKSDVRFLSENEIRQISTTMQNSDLSDPYLKDGYDLFLFYLYTGARAKEILYPYLDWNCIGQNSINFPNTKRSGFRMIPMTQTIKGVIKNREKIIGGPFFTTSNSQADSEGDLEMHHLTYDMVYDRVKNIYNLAGVKNASIHTLRKTAGAYYYMSTRDIFAASKFLGHSSVSVTESHYVGLIQSLQSKYSDEFDRFVSERMY